MGAKMDMEIIVEEKEVFRCLYNHKLYLIRSVIDAIANPQWQVRLYLDSNAEWTTIKPWHKDAYKPVATRKEYRATY